MEILLSAAAGAGSDDYAPCAQDPSPATSSAPQSSAQSPSDDVASPLRALIDHDLLSELPADLPELLRLLPNADLYVQDEVEIGHHPTLTRLWSRKGRHGQRRVRAPGQSGKVIAFGAVDWRDGCHSVGFGLRRTAALFCKQLDHLVQRSQGRGRMAMVILDNANIHTPWGSRLVRETLARHSDKLRLVYTPVYDPESNPAERLWPSLRRAVTHNHHRDEMVELYYDALAYFEQLDRDPDRVLRHIGSPFASNRNADCSPVLLTQV